MRKAVFLLPLLAATASATIVSDVVDSLNHNNFQLAESQVEQYRRRIGVTPEMIEAQSWIARASLMTNRMDRADAEAAQVIALCQAELKKRPLDADTHLPTALGAAIEVRAQVMTARGEHAKAVQFLNAELAAYRATSIADCIQKNLNLLNLEGKPAPPLNAAQYLGPKPIPLARLRGRPVLLFFWAHWCADCRAEAPLIAKIKQEFASKGLVVAGPTRLYGYTAADEHAPPAEEMKFMEAVRRRFYSGLADVPMPVSTANFIRYGASTTPTLVLIDRQGIVRLYHPGAMSPQELYTAVEKITG